MFLGEILWICFPFSIIQTQSFSQIWVFLSNYQFYQFQFSPSAYCTPTAAWAPSLQLMGLTGWRYLSSRKLWSDPSMCSPSVGIRFYWQPLISWQASPITPSKFNPATALFHSFFCTIMQTFAKTQPALKMTAHPQEVCKTDKMRSLLPWSNHLQAAQGGEK